MDFKSCFERIQSSLPIEWIDEKSKRNVLHNTPNFESFSIISIECKLASATNEVDLAVGFENDLLSDPSCQWIPSEQTLLKSILNKNHFLNDCVRGIWLNYDLSSAVASKAWAYIVLHKMNLGQEFNTALISQFFQSEYNEDEVTSFPGDVLKELPDHAYVLGLALEQHDHHGSSRLVVYGMTAGELITYLQAITSNVEMDLIKKMFAKFKFSTEEIGLILNIIDGKISNTIGFELVLADQPFEKVKYILDILLIEQLIHPAKHHALIQWGNRNNTSEADHGIRIWINHIKLTFSAQEAWSAKCYFGIQPGYPSFVL